MYNLTDKCQLINIKKSISLEFIYFLPEEFALFSLAQHCFSVPGVRELRAVRGASATLLLAPRFARRARSC